MAASPDPADQADYVLVRGVLLLMDGEAARAFDDLAGTFEDHPGIRMARPLNLLSHIASWSGDIRRVRRALALPEGKPWHGRVLEIMVRHLEATAAVLTDTDNGERLGAVADDLEALGLFLDATMTRAELALLPTDPVLAADADRRAREGFAGMGGQGLLGLYERALAGRR